MISPLPPTDKTLGFFLLCGLLFLSSIIFIYLFQVFAFFRYGVRPPFPPLLPSNFIDMSFVVCSALLSRASLPPKIIQLFSRPSHPSSTGQMRWYRSSPNPPPSLASIFFGIELSLMCIEREPQLLLSSCLSSSGLGWPSILSPLSPFSPSKFHLFITSYLQRTVLMFRRRSLIINICPPLKPGGQLSTILLTPSRSPHCCKSFKQSILVSPWISRLTSIKRNFFSPRSPYF